VSVPPPARAVRLGYGALAFAALTAFT